MIMHHHTKSGYERLSGSEDIFRTKPRQTDMVISVIVSHKGKVMHYADHVQCTLQEVLTSHFRGNHIHRSE